MILANNHFRITLITVSLDFTNKLMRHCGNYNRCAMKPTVNPVFAIWSLQPCFCHPVFATRSLQPGPCNPVCAIRSVQSGLCNPVSASKRIHLFQLSQVVFGTLFFPPGIVYFLRHSFIYTRWQCFDSLQKLRSFFQDDRLFLILVKTKEWQNRNGHFFRTGLSNLGWDLGNTFLSMYFLFFLSNF